MSILRPIHFHIRWADTLELDRLTFVTFEAANAVAQELFLSGEQCKVEEFDDSCATCRAPRKRLRGHRA